MKRAEQVVESAGAREVRMRRAMFLTCALAIAVAAGVSGAMMDARTVHGAGRVVARAKSGGQAAQPAQQAARLLKALQGTWAITDTLAPDAKNPKGVVGAGTIVWRPGPGGYSAVEEFHSKQGEQDVTGFGMMWWDEAANGYHTIWCDSTNPGGCIDFKNAAKWDGDELVLQEDYESKGKKFTFKEVFGEITATGFRQTLYGGEAGKELKVDEVIEGKRKN